MDFLFFKPRRWGKRSAVQPQTICSEVPKAGSFRSIAEGLPAGAQEKETVKIMGKRAYRLEDYLKRILCLSRKKPVHAADLARDLEVSRPTVCVFLKQLQRDGYVTVGAHHIITLTPKGMDIAKQTLQRHQTIQLLLEGLGVPREIASADACAIEHDLSPQSYEAIKCFTKAKK